MALQVDGKVLIGGAFTTVAGFPRPRLARLGTNGTLDATFPSLGITNGNVFAISLAPGGKILIGGNFRYLNNVPRSGVARLNGDGTLDTSFDPGAGAAGTVYTVGALTNGMVFIGGDFTMVNGTNRNRYALLRPDGSVSEVFDSTVGADNTVFASQVTPDQKIFIGGDFTTVGGVSREGVARLNVFALPSVAVLTGPQISGGVARISVTTTPHYVYILEGSSDLRYWLPLSTNVAAGVTLDLLDANYSGSGHRFYRVRIEE